MWEGVELWLEVKDGATLTTLEESVTKENAKNISDLTIAIDKKLFRDTPIDTKNARSNWVWDVTDEEDTGIVSEEIVASRRPSNRNPRQTVTPNRIMSDGKGKIIGANNTDYIVRLNDGSSRQAPSKFVEMAIEEAIGDIFGAD